VAETRINEDGELEKRCYKCGEWWPADEEFFYPGFAQCKACYLEDKYTKRRVAAAARKKEKAIVI